MRRTSIPSLILMICLAVSSFAKDKYLKADPVRLDREGERWAERTLNKLSLEEKIGQMIMISSRAQFTNISDPEYLRLRDTMRKYHIGGFGLTVPQQGLFLLKSEPYEAAALVNHLQKDSDLPLMIAADFERGASLRLNGSTVFPAAMAFGAAGKAEYAETLGRVTAQESRAIGVEWNWFPVADVNSNPANPIINTRAFGEDPRQVSELVAAYIRGSRSAGLLTTAKHFPGHGDTNTDSHLGLAEISGDRKRLDSIELVPFRSAIAAGVDSVMVAHVSVPALDPDANHVASNSPAIITDLLKKELGFKGIVVTDSLEMKGLMRLFAGTNGNPSARAAVETVKAGNDMIILPADLDAAYNALLSAVRNGEIPESQINASVLKILEAKASVGLHKARLVDMEALSRLVLNPENVAIAQQIADEAVTMLCDQRKLLPLRADASGTAGSHNAYTKIVEARNRVVAVIFSDDVRTEYGRVLERMLRMRIPDCNVIYVDPNNAAFSTQPILATIDQAHTVIAAIYSAPIAGKVINADGVATNSISMGNDSATLMQSILDRAAEKTVVVAVGSPYVGSDFRGIKCYMCTFSNAAVSEASAVRALFGEIAVRGKLPVSIPGLAERGFGIDRQPEILQGAKDNVLNKSSISR